MKWKSTRRRPEWVLTGEAKADIKATGTVKTHPPYQQTRAGQTREIIGSEHEEQNSDSLILCGDTEAGRGHQCLNLVCASNAYTHLGIIQEGVLGWYCDLYLH